MTQSDLTFPVFRELRKIFCDAIVDAECTLFVEQKREQVRDAFGSGVEIEEGVRGG